MSSVQALKIRSGGIAVVQVKRIYHPVGITNQRMDLNVGRPVIDIPTALKDVQLF